MEGIILRAVSLSMTVGLIVLLVLVLKKGGRKVPVWLPGLLGGLIALSLICLVSIENTLGRIADSGASDTMDEGNTEFLEEENAGTVKWVDFYDSPDEILECSGEEAELPEFPGIIFQYNMGQVTAVTESGNTALISGMPIWNVYFTDLTGDGRREICATVGYGSEFSDTHAVVIDYAAFAEGSEEYEYTLWDRGQYDYVFHMKEDKLYCEQWEYLGGELATRGNPVIRSDSRNQKYLEINAATVKVRLSNSTANMRGLQMGYLYVPISGLTYRYEMSDLDPETVTADELLDKFTKEVSFVGQSPSKEFWRIYSVEEYPDCSVMLAVSDAGEQVLYQHCPPKGVNASDLQKAIDMGCILMKNGDVSSGQEMWQDFLNAVEKGEEVSVKIAYYYTLDSINCSKELYEVYREDYPELYIDTLSYDGQGFTLTTVSGSVRYKYLRCYTGDGPSGAAYGSYTRYVLTDDDTATWEKLIKSGVSSQLGAWIKHASVYTDLVYEGE